MEARTPKEDRKALVVRHNKLIESRHRLTLLERRFMLWIISQIKQEDSQFHKYSISVKNFVDFSSLKDHGGYYQQISKMADSLTQKNIAIKNQETKKDKYYSWFESIEYDWGNGQIFAEINNKIRPFLLDLKEQYTVITLEYALLLKRPYTHRLYDLLKQYERIGERTMEIEQMKDIFDISGKYPKYKDLRVRIIQPAQEEINKKTDISFDFFPIKKGRKVESIRFEIHKNRPEVTLDNPEETNPQAKTLFQKLLRYGVQEKSARELVGNYENDRVKWHIAEYENRMKGETKPEGVGWLVKGIKEDYRPQKNIFEKVEKDEREKKEKIKRQQQAIEKEIDKIKEECDQENKVCIDEIIEAMTEEEKSEMLDSVQNRFGSVFNISGKSEKEGLSNPMVYRLCSVYTREKYPEKIKSYLDFAKSKKGIKKVILKELEKTHN